MLLADEVPVTAGPNSGEPAADTLSVVDGIALVPTAYLLLLPLHLPLPSARKRREAVPFAMEEHLSEPLEDLHFAIGNTLGSQHFLAAAVERDRMRSWIATLDGLGVGDAVLVPDVLTLPVPQMGQWAVRTEQARALVRTGDGGGFATRLDRLETFWMLAGQPAIICDDDTILPEALSVSERRALPLLPGVQAAKMLDLRQGEFARSRRGPSLGFRPADSLGRHLRTAAFITAGGLAAHAAIAAADTLALTLIARQTRAETETLVALARPGSYVGGDALMETAAGLVPDRGADSPAFLPLLSSLSTSMGEGVRFEAIDWSAKDGTAQLRIEAPDSAALTRIRDQMKARGLGTGMKMPVRRGEGLLAEMTVREGE